MSDNDDEMPPDPAPGLLLVDGFALKGSYDDGTPFERRSDLAIIQFLPADLKPCPDCGVEPNQPHVDGCDVAPCTACGWQRISCEHEESDVGWGHVWTGKWPGKAEIEEGLATGINDLDARARQGLLRWNGTRWIAR